MQEIWRKISPYFHVAALIFTAGVAWAGVASQSERIDKLESKQEQDRQIVVDMRISIARVEEGVKDIKRALRINNE